MYEDKNIVSALTALNVTAEQGLDEATVKAKQQSEGPNKLSEKKKKSLFLIFLSEFKDPMVIVLFVAALISLGLGIYDAVKAGRSYGIGDMEWLYVLLLSISPLLVHETVVFVLFLKRKAKEKASQGK